MSSPEPPPDPESPSPYEAPPPPPPGIGYGEAPVPEPSPGPTPPEPAPQPAPGPPPPAPPPYGTPGYGPPPPPYGTPGYGPPPPQYGQGPVWPPDPSAPWGRQPLTGRPYSDKSKLVAGLLQIFVGYTGAGRWYTGQYGIAVAQLLTCGGCGIWSLIDGILMLVGKVDDSYGRPLRD